MNIQNLRFSAVLLYLLLLFQNTLANEPSREDKINMFAQYKDIMQQYRKDHNQDRAREGLLQVHQKDPTFDKPIYHLARLAEKDENWAEAIAWYQQLLQLSLNTVVAEKAEIHLMTLEKLHLNGAEQSESQTQQYREALKIEKALLKEDELHGVMSNGESTAEADIEPIRFDAYLMAGTLFVAQQQCDQAQVFLDEALKLTNKATDKRLITTIQAQCKQEQAYQMLLLQAAQQSKAQQFFKAAKTYEKAWQQFPTHGEAGLAAATHYSLSKENKTSRKILEKLIKSPSPAIAFEAGQKLDHLQLDLKPKANADIPRQDYRNIGQMPGGEAYVKAVALLEKGHIDEAENQLNSAIDAVPFYSKYGYYFYSRGEINLKRKNYQQAIYDLRIAAMLKPKIADIYIQLGESYFFEKAYKLAIETYDKGLLFARDDLSTIDFYYLKGKVKDDIGDYPGAIEELEYFLKNSLENARYRDNAKALLEKIQFAYALQNVYEDKAYQLGDESIRNEPVSMAQESQQNKSKPEDQDHHQADEVIEQEMDDL